MLAVRDTIQASVTPRAAGMARLSVATELAPVSEAIQAPAARRRTIARAAAVFLWLGFLASAASIVVMLASHGGVPIGDVASLIAFFVFATVGVVLAVRLPGNAVGWILAIVGVAAAAHRALGAYVTIAAAGEPLAGVAIAAWLDSWSWAISFGPAVILLPLVFPSGHLPIDRERALLWIATAIFALGPLAIAFTPGPFFSLPSVNNPFGIEPLGPLLRAVDAPLVLLSVIPIVACAAVPVQRFRRAEADERHQLKWFAFAVVALATSTLANAVVDDALTVVVAICVALVPMAIGLAILRYRLYDIDVIINRTLVWVPLTALLGGLYAALVSLLQRVFVNLTGDRSDGAIIITTLVLAGLFTPARKVLDGIVDRRFRTTSPSGPPHDEVRTAVVVDDPLLIDKMERIAERVARDVVRSERRASRANRPPR
jgi:hypothetical protein